MDEEKYGDFSISLQHVSCTWCEVYRNFLQVLWVPRSVKSIVVPLQTYLLTLVLVKLKRKCYDYDFEKFT